MPTLHTIHRTGKVTIVGIPERYNITGLNFTENGNINKSYSLSPRACTRIKDAIVKQFAEKKHRLTFWTFTFKNDHETAHVVTSQKIMNKYFSNLLETTKKVYKLHSYVWVSERTEKNAIHYHCVFDLPYLKKSTVYENYLSYFKCSFCDLLRLHGVRVRSETQYCSIGFPKQYDRNGVKRGSVVRSVESITNYLSGYLAKQSGRREYNGRLYGISRNILQPPVKRYSSLPEYLGLKKEYVNKYCTIQFYNYSQQWENYFRYYSHTSVKTNAELRKDHKKEERKLLRKAQKVSEICGISHKIAENSKYKRNKRKALSRQLTWDSMEKTGQIWTIANDIKDADFERSVRQALKYFDEKYTAILT